MSYKYTLNPKYTSMLDSLKNIKDIFFNADISIHKARNELKIIEIDGLKCVVKSFKVPHILNRFIYTYIRDSKAKKSYTNAVKLQELSVNTPDPIGIIEFFDKGLISNSFFISLYEPYDFTIREVFHHKVDNYKKILIDFIHFTYDIHTKNVLHVDYSPGNILITLTDDSCKFSLVDINRMSFQNISSKEGLENFSKFWATDEDLHTISNTYANLRNIDGEEAYKILRKYTKKTEDTKKLKLSLKKLISKG